MSQQDFLFLQEPMGYQQELWAYVQEHRGLIKNYGLISQWLESGTQGFESDKSQGFEWNSRGLRLEIQGLILKCQGFESEIPRV